MTRTNKHATVTLRAVPERLATPPAARSTSAKVGPVYGVREFIRRMTAGYLETHELEKEWHADARAATRRPMSTTTMDDLAARYKAILARRCTLHWEQQAGRRLGKPCITILAYVVEPLTMQTAPDDDEARTFCEDVVLIRRIGFTLSGRRIEQMLTHAHMVISRHTLERLYKRERCTLATFDATFRHGLLRLLDAFALVLATRTAAVSECRFGERIDAALPLGNGLVLASSRTMYQLNEMNSCVRAVIQAGVATSRATPYNKFLAGPTTNAKVPVVASIMLATRTYISSRDMSMAKTHYLEAFNALLDDYDLAAVREAMFAPQLQNEDGERTVDWPNGMGGRIVELSTILDRGGIINPSEAATCDMTQVGTTAEELAARMDDDKDEAHMFRVLRQARNTQL